MDVETVRQTAEQIEDHVRGRLQTLGHTLRGNCAEAAIAAATLLVKRFGYEVVIVLRAGIVRDRMHWWTEIPCPSRAGVTDDQAERPPMIVDPTRNQFVPPPTVDEYRTAAQSRGAMVSLQGECPSGTPCCYLLADLLFGLD